MKRAPILFSPTMSQEWLVTGTKFFKDLWEKVTTNFHYITQGEPPVPWDEDWQLNSTFFEDLKKWEERHSQSTLVKVLEQVDGAISKSQPFLQLIPDKPFPAYTLVHSLAYLFQLAKIITSAHNEIHDFITQITEWLSKVVEDFSRGNVGPLAQQAKENLTGIKNLINEICKWGWLRLNDGRWSSLLNGLAISSEIRLYKEKLTEARLLFLAMQSNNITFGVDEVLKIVLEIKNILGCPPGDIWKYLNDRDDTENRRRFLNRTLPPEIALLRTAYDDQGKHPCDADTRVEIIKDIKNWVNDVSPDTSQNFLWLSGDPGSGKSAVTASLARYCKDEGTLWAQFFINRNNEATTNPRVYFPSIARQMAEYSPPLLSPQDVKSESVSKVVYSTLKHKPSILDRMTNNQGLELFVQVMQAACDLDLRKPVVVVIDGLDETTRKSLQDTAEIISSLFMALARPNAKVFISSRTDDEITRPFYRSIQSNKDYVKHLHLKTDSETSFNDVSRFLRRKLYKIVTAKNLNWEMWPSEEGFQTLCQNAGGLFIWAVTVVNFFEEEIRVYGHERLRELLKEINREGMGDVDMLYQTILKATYASNANRIGWAHETFRWVMGFIIALKEPLSIEGIAALHDLRRTPTSSHVDMLQFTTNLRTVLVAGADEIDMKTIPRLHKSFVEFITSDRAEPQFRVDLPAVNVEIGLKCLRLVQRLRNSGDRASIPPESIRYAIRYWAEHLPNLKQGTASGLAIFGGDIQNVTTTMSKFMTASRNGFLSAYGDYQTHIYDPAESLPPPVPMLSPLQFKHHSTIKGLDMIYSVAMSRDGSLIASGTSSGIIRLWHGKTHQPIGKPLIGHNEPVFALCFFPDSRRLVSGNGDGSVRVWDCRTGLAVGASPLWGHISAVTSVSTDGRLIVSGSIDHTIYIWDADTRHASGHKFDAGARVFAVALSTDGRIAAGVEKDIGIWDAITHVKLASLDGHNFIVSSIAFSPDNKRLVSGSADRTIRLWATNQGDFKQTTQVVMTGHTGWVRSVSFSSDGRWVVSGSDDKSVWVWNGLTGEAVDSLRQGYPNPGSVFSVTFAPRCRQIISGSNDGNICVWAAQSTNKWPELPQQVTTLCVTQQKPSPSPHIITFEGKPCVAAASYSPDRTFYAASTLDGRVSVWTSKEQLVWESNRVIHPIHLLRFSDTQLTASCPDGSKSTWNLMSGKNLPTRGAQLEAAEVHRFRSQSSSDNDNPVVQWFPFGEDAGCWAYVSGTLIRFESDGNSNGAVTFIERTTPN